MNPLKPLVRFVAPFFRWWPRPAQEIPIERPPGGRARASRTHVVWNSSGQLHPYPLTIAAPEHDDHWRR